MRASQLLLALTVCSLVHGQDVGRELVANGGFEEVTGNVKTWDQFDRVTGWKNITLGLSEIFDKSGSPKNIGIPANDYGSIEPKEGERYAGFFAWKDDVRYNQYEEGMQDPLGSGWTVYAEYLQTELREPLDENKTYEVSFWVALAQNSDRAVSALGAYASPFALDFQHRKFLAEKAQVYTEEVMNKKGEWQEVKGRFIAYGDETHLIIGTFPYVGFTTERMVDGLDNQYAYYYVDSISLKQVTPEEPKSKPNPNAVVKDTTEVKEEVPIAE